MKPDSIDRDGNDAMARGVTEDVERYMGEIIMDPHFFIF